MRPPCSCGCSRGQCRTVTEDYREFTTVNVQALTLTVDGSAEIGEATSLANLAFTVDLTVRTMRGILECLDNGDQINDSGTEITFETVWSMRLLQGAVWKLFEDGM